MYEKYKQTCLDKYGVENVRQADWVKEKSKQTNLIRYGVDNPAKSPEIIEKIKQTNKERWPDASNYHNFKQARQTLIQHCGSMEKFYEYRYENTDWEKLMQKQYETKRKNNSFNYSKPEEELYLELCEKYGNDNVIRNYKEERYPFRCDFYIPSEDLFIELNKHWTHGGHFFDPENPDDIKKLEEWEERAKTSKFFDYAVLNWTIRDPLKLKTAIENKLNYKVIW